MEKIGGGSGCRSQAITDIGYLGCILSVLILCGVMIRCAGFQYIWVDEAFTLQLIQHSFCDVIWLTGTDVHPPLYYLIVKSVVDIADAVFGDSVSRVTVARFVSVVPYMVLLGVCAIYVRQKMGKAVAGVSAVFLFAAPRFLHMGMEIRMYSWAMLFVTLAFLAYIEIVREDNRRAWWWFGFTTLACFYTHNYAGAAAGFLYVVLGLHAFLNRSLLRALLLCSISVFFLYLPWLFVLMHQVGAVRESYWIPELTKDSGYTYLFYMLGIDSKHLLRLTVMIIAFCCVRGLWGQPLKRVLPPCVGVLLPIVVTLLGVAASLLMRPVFVERYMYPAVFAFWIGSLYATSHAKPAAGRRILLLLMGMLALVYTLSFPSQYRTMKAQERQTAPFLELAEKNPSAVYIASSSHIHRTANVLTGRPGVAWRIPVTLLTERVYKGQTPRMDTVEQLRAFMDEAGGPLFYLSEASSGDDMGEQASQFMKETGCTLTKQLRARVGLHEVDVYLVSGI